MPTHDSGQSRAQRQTGETEETEVATDSTSDVAERHEKLTEDVDAILDEIDDVLETNAEEFVRSFVQKGGQ
jgi:ubiquitin-like protein Pup